MPLSRQIVFSLAALASVAAGCRTPAPLYSARPVTPATVIDGRADEWPLALRPVPGEAGLGLGLRRDAGALVVAVVASDERQARRIALGGLRLWLDPNGGRERAVGVRFPAPGPLGERVLRVGARSGAAAEGDLRRRFLASLDTLEVTRGAAPAERVGRQSVPGLEAAAAWGERGLVVEMRLPLDLPPGGTSQGTLGLGVELVEVVRAAPRPSRAMDLPPERPGRPLPRPDEPRPETRPAPTVASVTRWLRID